jgi:hypothetical protein
MLSESILIETSSNANLEMSSIITENLPSEHNSSYEIHNVMIGSNNDNNLPVDYHSQGKGHLVQP